jgi:hypothetical protein
MKTPFPPQQQHIETLVQAIRSNHAAVDSSSTGTGKTLCASEVAKVLGYKMLVIAPKATLENWRRVAAEQEAGVLGVVNYEKLRTGKTEFGFWKSGHFIFNIPAGTMLVFDEAHACKGLYTKNAKMMLAAKGRPTLILSATLAENPTEMRALGFLLNLHRLHDFYGWALKNGCGTNPWGALEFKSKSKEAQRALDSLRRSIYPAKGHMMTRDDLREFFTTNQIIYDPIEFGSGAEIKSLLDEVAEELQAIADKEAEERQALAGNPAEAMVKLTRARQKVELLKLPEMQDLVEERLSEGKSVAIFLNYNQSVRALSDRLTKAGIPHGLLWGLEDHPTKRQRVIDDFQHDRVHVIICNIAAGGTGVNLHHTETSERPREALISPNYNAKIMEQVFGRIDRAGAKSDTINRVLVAAGSVEEKVLEAVQIKIDNLRRLHNKSDITTMPRTPKFAPKKDETPAAETTPEVVEALARVIEVAPEPPAEPLTAAQAVEKNAERGHAPFSPSKLEQISICPGYTGGKSNERAMEAAESGTRCHAACETGIVAGLSDEELMLVEMAMGYEADVTEGADKILREICVEVHDQWGFLDTVALRGTKADIIDFKFGRMPVRDAEKNLQMKAYTHGIWQMYPEVEEVTVHIVQPKLDTISFHTWVRSRDAETIAAELKFVIERAKEVQSNFFAEDYLPLLKPFCESCDFCGNRHRCPALTKEVLSIVSKYSGDTKLDRPVVSPGEMRDPKEASRLLRAAKYAAKWAEDVQSWALDMALNEGIVPEDFRLVEVNKPRKVTNPLLAYEALKDSLSMEDVMACATGVSIGKLEDVFCQTAPKGQKAKYKAQLTDRLTDAGALVAEGVYHKLDPIRSK